MASQVERAEIPRQTSSAGNSVTVRLKLQNIPGTLSKVLDYVGTHGASIGEVKLVYSDFNTRVRDLTMNCISAENAREIVAGLRTLKRAEVLDWKDDTFEMHKGGKLNISGRSNLETTDELARAYTPGVARVCTAIHQEPEKAYEYTIKNNCIAVVTDGSAVLGLGDIGPAAALPVMEGKAMLFKQFADLNAFPICLATQDTEEIIRTVKHISPGFAGINLEDISAPRCFEIESRLDQELPIPVFHDDQHGTAIVVLAGVINAMKLVGKKLQDIKVVVNGFGAGGVACTRMLLEAGISNIIPCDRAGIVYRGRKERMNPVKEALIARTNPDNLQGDVATALKGADVFIGVSKPGAITRGMVENMASDPVVFALANPVPEIMPEEIRDIARIIATGRSDYANQINNVLCFPGIFRGAIDCRAERISDRMKVAAAYAISECIAPSELHEQHIIPGVFHTDVAKIVAEKVRQVAIEEGLSKSLE